jgi:hypothetical protein
MTQTEIEEELIDLRDTITGLIARRFDGPLGLADEDRYAVLATRERDLLALLNGSHTAGSGHPVGASGVASDASLCVKGWRIETLPFSPDPSRLN